MSGSESDVYYLLKVALVLLFFAVLLFYGHRYRRRRWRQTQAWELTDGHVVAAREITKPDGQGGYTNAYEEMENPENFLADQE